MAYNSDESTPQLTLEGIGSCLSGYAPCVLPPTGKRVQAAVALILREDPTGEPHILFIERARRPGDPWSGDIGFPGGKMEEADAEVRFTAERETWEEIGLELRPEDYLGRLDDLTGAHLPVQVACFAYALRRSPSFTLSEEVSGAFWVPLPLLLDRRRYIQTAVRFRGEELLRPGIDLLGPDRPPLWGLTYRLVGQFMEILGFNPEDTDPTGDFLRLR